MRTTMDDILDLIDWHLAGARGHAAALARRTVGLLTGEQPDLSPVEVTCCKLLDSAVYALLSEAATAHGLLQAGPPLPPAAAARADALADEYDRVLAGWRRQMEAVQHVWGDRNPPQ